MLHPESAHSPERVATPPFPKACGLKDILERLKEEEPRVYQKDVETLLKENACSMQSQETLFSDIDVDLRRTTEGTLHIIDGVEYDGSEGKDAAAILAHLKNKIELYDEDILRFMTLLHQGVFAKIWDRLSTDLALKKASLYASGDSKNTTLFEYCKSISRPICRYKVTTDKRRLVLQCCQYMALTNTNPESPTYREKPYGIVCINVELDWKKQTAAEYWQVIAVFDERAETPPLKRPEGTLERLKKETPRVYEKSMQTLFEESADVDEIISNDALFLPINLEMMLSQCKINDMVFDGSEERDAAAIVEKLKKETELDENTIYSLMSLFHQRVFAHISDRFSKDLELSKASVCTSNDCSSNNQALVDYCEEISQPICLYEIKFTETGCFFNCCQYMTLLDSFHTNPPYRDGPYGIVRLNVQLDLVQQNAFESWEIVKIFDP